MLDSMYQLMSLLNDGSGAEDHHISLVKNTSWTGLELPAMSSKSRSYNVHLDGTDLKAY